MHHPAIPRMSILLALFFPASIPLVMADVSKEQATTEHTVGDVHVSTRLIFSESFASMANWKNLAPRTVWAIDGGKLKGYWAPGGSAIWLNREFEGNILVIAEAKVRPPDPAFAKSNRPEGSKNFNLRFHVRGPADVDILDAYPTLLAGGTGMNGIGDDQYRGYFITWTWRHSRLRRSPGYINVSENTSILPESNKTHRVQLLFLNGRILFTADGELLHDYTDPKPFTQGKMAIVTSNSNVEVSRFDVYRVLPSTKLTPQLQ